MMPEVDREVSQVASKSNEVTKRVKTSFSMDPRIREALKLSCIKRFGSAYGKLSRELENAVALYLTAVDKQQPFTILCSQIKLRSDVARKLNGIIVAISQVAHALRTTILSHKIIVEVIKDTLNTDEKRTVNYYINLLLQHGVERDVGADSDTGTNTVLYNVKELTRVYHGDGSSFKDINRTETSSIVENAGRHSRNEDQSMPENNRVGLKREQGEGKYKDA